MKFQAANNVSPVAGYVGPITRAAITAVCGSGPGPGPGPVTGGQVMVSAGAQPVNSLAPQGASRVPFTTFTLSNGTSAAVIINSVTIQRVGLGVDANFSGIVLLDSNGLQVGIAKTLNSNHQANIGDSGFIIPANSSATFTVAGNIATGQSTNGQIVGLQVVAINTGATVSGSLPISGASQTINNTLTLGSVSTSTSSFDPGSTQQRNIGDLAVRFSGLKFTAGSTEDLKLYSVRWRQVGSASSADLANTITVAGGTSYPATVDSTGKYYTTIFPGGLLITKGNSLDVYIQGDIVGSNSASRTIDFDIDRVTDVYFVGQLYGYGVAPSGSYQPWFTGYAVTINAGTLTTISKSNTGFGAAQNVAINVSDQPMGGFITNFTGEAVSVQGMVFTIATSSLTASGSALFTNVSIYDENGSIVAGPVDATNASSGQTLTFSDTVTFATGIHSYYLKGKVSSNVTAGSFSISSTPSSGWSNPTGQSSGNTISLSGAGTVTMNSMTVKPGSLNVSMSTSPSSQNIVSGVSAFTFANILLDAQQSGEDVRLASIPLLETGSGPTSNLTGCQIWDGATALNTGSRVVNTPNATTKTTFSLDNVLRVTKGTIKSLALKCNLSSSATSSSTYIFSNSTTASDWSVTGDVSGVTIGSGSGLTLTSSSGGTMTVQSASLTIAVDSSSPASTTVSGGATGQTLGVYRVRAANDTVTLTKVGLTLTSGAAGDVTRVYLYNGSTLVGEATFGSGQSVATSTLNGGGLLLSPDVDVKLTVKADIADIGTGKSGTNGAVVQIDPNSAEGIGSTGTVQADGSGAVAGVRMYNSYPVFSYDTTGATLFNGVNTLLTLNVTADAQGSIGLWKLTFGISTTTVLARTPTFTGPNGNVASTTLVFDTPVGDTLVVFFDSTSNTADAIVGAGETKTYSLKATISGLTGSNSGTVATLLKADTTHNSTIVATTSLAASKMVWAPMATTTSLDQDDDDYANGYALMKGCFATAGLGADCTARVLAN